MLICYVDWIKVITDMCVSFSNRAIVITDLHIVDYQTAVITVNTKTINKTDLNIKTLMLFLVANKCFRDVTMVTVIMTVVYSDDRTNYTQCII